MFENIIKFFKNLGKKEKNKESSDTAKERLHLVLMQDRANVSADFLELMRKEIIEVIKKYIDVDEKAIDVRLTNKTNEDGTVGAPALYANIPIVTIKNEARKVNVEHNETENTEQTVSEDKKVIDDIKTEKEDKETVKKEQKVEEIQKEESDKEETEKAEKTDDLDETIKQEEVQEPKEKKEEIAQKVEVVEEATNNENKEKVEEVETKGIENKKEEQNENKEA